MKYNEDLGQIVSDPPNQCGSGNAIEIPMMAVIMLKIRLEVIPSRSTLRAPSSSRAPTQCATCTEYPEVIAEHMPQNSQRLVDTNPMDAESSAPSRPTIEASIYCIAMLDSWASIAGRDNDTVRLSRCRHDRLFPSRISLISVVNSVR